MSFIDWARLDPDTIEKAVKILLVELHPGARPIDGRGGDGGRDVRWDSPDGLTIFEIKSFAGDQPSSSQRSRLSPGQRKQIKQSLGRAARYNPVRWVLVLPTDHSPGEEAWFDDLAANHPAIEVDWRGLNWLNLQFSKREYLRRLVEGESYELLRLAREFEREEQVVTSGADAVTRMAALSRRAQDLSACWRLDFSTGPDGIVGTFRERFPGAAALDPVQLRASFDFPKGDAHADETRRQLDAVVDYGGDAEVDGRYVANFEVLASPQSQALFDTGVPTERLRITSGAGQADDTLTYQMVIVAPSGQVKHRLPLQMDPVTTGLKGARVTGHDPTGTFVVTIIVERPEQGSSVSVQIRARGGAGRYPYALRPAYEMFARTDPGDRLEIRVDDRNVAKNAPNMERFLAAARFFGELIDALEKLQNHSGMLFPIPDDLTRVDARDLIEAAHLLTGQQITVGSAGIDLTVKEDRIEAFLDLVPSEPTAFTGQIGYGVTCGPHQIELGLLTVTAPRVRLTNTAELRAAIGTGVDPVAHLECTDGESIYLQLTSTTGTDTSAA